MKDMPKKRVGILGFYCAPNYGAVLTSTALYLTVKKLGYEPELVHIPYSIWQNNETCRNEESFSNRFLRQYCEISSEAESEEQIKALNEQYDIFLTGSDQLWCTRIYENSSLFFFLDFAADDKRKVAYATSLGEDSFNGNRDEQLEKGRLLRRFDALSVREKSGAEYLEKEHFVAADCCIDPVFFWDSYFYTQMAENVVKPSGYGSSKKYLLAHFVGNKELREQKLKIATKMAEELELSLKVITVGILVEEYLALISKCAFVVTDSFHGVCFSLIFEKEFLVVAEGRNSMSRFRDIAERFDIENRIFYEDAIVMQNCAQWKRKLDFEKIRNRIQEEREKGLRWLKAALWEEEGHKTPQQRINERLCAIEDQLHALSIKLNMQMEGRIQILEEQGMPMQKELFRSVKDIDAYIHQINQYQYRMIVVLSVYGDGADQSYILEKLSAAGLRKRELLSGMSYVAVMDRKRNFVYENMSSNRIAYHHKISSLPEIFIVSEGTALEECRGDSSVRRYMTEQVNRLDTELSVRLPGVNIVIFDADSCELLDSCNIGAHNNEIIRGRV